MRLRFACRSGTFSSSLNTGMMTERNVSSPGTRVVLPMKCYPFLSIFREHGLRASERLPLIMERGDWQQTPTTPLDFIFIIKIMPNSAYCIFDAIFASFCIKTFRIFWQKRTLSFSIELFRFNHHIYFYQYINHVLTIILNFRYARCGY